jgi:hypothetical protein
MLRWAVLNHTDVSATVSYTLPSSVYASSGSTAMVAAMAVSDRIASEKVRRARRRPLPRVLLRLRLSFLW